MKAARCSLFFISLILAVSACALPPRWNRVQPGMTKEEVIGFVGEPKKRTYDDDVTLGIKESWYYEYKHPGTGEFTAKTIRFRDGRVTSMVP